MGFDIISFLLGVLSGAVLTTVIIVFIGWKAKTSDERIRRLEQQVLFEEAVKYGSERAAHKIN